jgi:predicted nucleic-acid-binding Zn-ribbon protein
MRSGICPKCRADSVYATNLTDHNFLLPTGEKNILISKVLINEVIQTERYVCANCGYFETYVANRQFLQGIADSPAWIKV